VVIAGPLLRYTIGPKATTSAHECLFNIEHCRNEDAGAEEAQRREKPQGSRPGRDRFRAELQGQRSAAVLFDIYWITVYVLQVIRTFGCAETERLFRREAVRRFRAIKRQGLRKLDMLDAAPDCANAFAVAGKPLGTIEERSRGPVQHSHQRSVATMLRVARRQRL